MKPMGIQLRYLALSAVLLVAAAAVAVVTVLERRSSDNRVIGMVRTTELRLAPEVGGRISEIRFSSGQDVRKGDIVAVLASPEIDAAVEQARRALAVAEAERGRVYAGVRKEEVQSAEREVGKARASLDLAREQSRRATALLRTRNISQQAFDDRQAELRQATAALATAESAYAEARRGPTAEDRAIADRTVDAARAALEQVLRHQDKLTIRSPVDGVLGAVVAEVGEAVTLAEPVATLAITGEPWFSFNVREDALNGIEIGSQIRLLAGDGKTHVARVTELRPLGDYAVWHAEQAIGAYDLATFQIRADRVSETAGPAGLQAGMSVWLTDVEEPQE